MEGRTPQRSQLIALVVLVLTTVSVLGRGLAGGFVWDDHQLVTVDAGARGLSDVGRALTTPFFETRGALAQGEGYYRPVVKLAYSVEHALFGQDPLGYHVVGLLLHLACVLLAFGFLLRRLGPGEGRLAGATVGACLFAIHPTRPESVTWVSGSTDLWMTLFALLALRALERRSRAGLVGGALLAAVAVFAKEAAVVLPALVATDALLLARTPEERRGRLQAAGAAAVAVGLALAVRFAVVPAPARMSEGIAAGLVPRVLSSLGHYLAITSAAPEPSAMRALVHFDAQGAPLYEGWSVALGAAVAVALVALAAASRWRPDLRPALADSAYWAVGLAPVLNLVPLGFAYLVADRYLYLPLLGVSALCARGVAAGAAAGGRRRTLVLGLAGAVLLALAGVTVGHVETFLDDGSLWVHEHEVEPDNTLALEMLTYASLSGGRPDLAARFAREGLAAADRLGDARAARRFALLTLDLEARATPDEQRARLAALLAAYDALAAGQAVDVPVRDGTLSLRPAAAGRPPDGARQFGLPRARLLDRLGRAAEAERALGALAREEPDSWEVAVALAEHLAAQGRLVEAAAEARRGASLPRAPTSAGALAADLEARARGGAGPGSP